jgi:ribosome-associated heat shock protein Hsp15
MAEQEKLRLDKYLWSIRLFKTRSQAADACDSGKVKLRGDNVKPARAVNVGDEFNIKTEARRWRIVVTGLVEKRVQYSEAIKCYKDVTPPEELERPEFQVSSFNTGKRQSKIGRPTKKERRDLDDFTAP